MSLIDKDINNELRKKALEILSGVRENAFWFDFKEVLKENITAKNVLAYGHKIGKYYPGTSIEPPEYPELVLDCYNFNPELFSFSIEKHFLYSLTTNEKLHFKKQIEILNKNKRKLEKKTTFNIDITVKIINSEETEWDYELDICVNKMEYNNETNILSVELEGC